ncbi:hypothetical protein [Nostoc sp. ChiQUE01b]|uniref:hypothetical protein n=1 Tax=Nostoc sp. ChiQUE01b TaxID=3075376 RepID=UPI002AD468F3|nr:hypothetical protein [Nostoc sp. ChiQUE01b]MDZ8264003.1 hypothetical protein [Nostoc sp. ChiQUE01b]
MTNTANLTGVRNLGVAIALRGWHWCKERSISYLLIYSHNAKLLFINGGRS